MKLCKSLSQFQLLQRLIDGMSPNFPVNHPLRICGTGYGNRMFSLNLVSCNILNIGKGMVVGNPHAHHFVLGRAYPTNDAPGAN